VFYRAGVIKLLIMPVRHLALGFLLLSGCDVGPTTTVSGTVRHTLKNNQPEVLPNIEVHVYGENVAELYERESLTREKRVRDALQRREDAKSQDAERARAAHNEASAAMDEYAREKAKQFYDKTGSPFTATRTNDQGLFTIRIPTGKKYLLTAVSRTLSSDGKEYAYYWFVPIFALRRYVARQS
jgi:hypothetical protein